MLHSRKASETCTDPFYGIKVLGSYNNKGQTAGMVYTNDVVFGIQEQNYAISCWNRDLGLKPYTVQLLAGGREVVPFLVDLQLDPCCRTNHYLYALSNNFISIAFDGFNPNYPNFKIVFVDLEEVFSIYPYCKTYLPNKCYNQYEPPVYSQGPSDNYYQPSSRPYSEYPQPGYNSSDLPSSSYSEYTRNSREVRLVK